MGMTEALLETRRRHLGASETPVILGLSPYKGATPDKVYWSKVGPPVESDAEHLQMGSDFEPALVQYAQRKLGETFVTDPKECFQVLLEGIGKGILSATPDGVLMRHANGSSRRWGLEGKAVMHGNPDVDAWGEPETDKVPDNVLVQCQQQMEVWNLDLVWVPVLWCIGYRPEFRMYKVERDPALFNEYIAPPAVEWWHKHVVAKTPPGDEPPPLAVLKAIQRYEGVMIDAEPDHVFLIDSWDAARKARIEAEKHEQALLASVLAEMGEAEGFVCPDGRKLTYREQKGARRIDLEALQSGHPDIYSQLVTQPTHRVARLVGKAKATT